VGSLPEEPLRNACVAAMSVAQNLALREFDVAPLARAGWLSPARLVAAARSRIEAFGVRTRGPDSPIGTLSGGNVQRAVDRNQLKRMIRELIRVAQTTNLNRDVVVKLKKPIGLESLSKD
jgi:simple sugar transport system ATP-binding protein